MSYFDFVAPIYEIFHFGANKTFKILNELGKFQRTDKVLDLGGGTGRISMFFINKVKEIVVLDSSPGMIKKCQTHIGLSCVVGLAEKIPFPDDYFDKIIINDAFHHFKNQEAVCKEIKRVLKTIGEVLIEEFNPETIFGKIIVKTESLLKMQSKFHDPKSLSKLFEKYRFKTEIVNENKTIYYLTAEKI